MTPADVKAYALIMKEFGVRRVQGEMGTEETEEFCIEMDASAFVAAPALPASAPLPPEREPNRDEIAFASSIPVTDAERGGREP